ncbi:MAG: ribonuclease P protein component [Chloroflexi bacterium]|nr:MAG: ribonuclease P protein component [Chloroflexota bacterium]
MNKAGCPSYEDVTEQRAKRFKLRHIRLKDKARIGQLRREGLSWVHPRIILLGFPNDAGKLRVAFSASRKLSKAVQRNRAKRLLREAVRLQQHHIKKGWDLLFIARGAAKGATLDEMKSSVKEVLQKAGLWEKEPCR